MNSTDIILGVLISAFSDTMRELQWLHLALNGVLTSGRTLAHWEWC